MEKNPRQQQTVFPSGGETRDKSFFFKLRVPVNCLLLLCFWKRKKRKTYYPANCHACAQRHTHARTMARQAEMGKNDRKKKANLE